MAKKVRTVAAHRRSACPLANALDLFGDKWTLVVVRDLIAGKKRYGDFANSPEGIPTNILADRLHRLERHGIVRKTAYHERPQRYEYMLTAKGADLLPVVQAMANWSSAHVSGCWAQPEWFVKLKPADLVTAGAAQRGEKEG